MKIKQDIKLDFADVLIEPKPGTLPLTRKDVVIEFDWLDTTAHPIAVSNMVSTGTYKIAKLMTAQRVFTFLHKEYTLEQHEENLNTFEDRRYIAITTGVRDKDIDKTSKVLEKFPDVGMINIDIANVYANWAGMLRAIKHFKYHFPNIKVSAGNIATPDLIERLANAGADFVKVGVGSGAACKTRSEVGVGVPQLSAVMECFEQAQKYNLEVISDGGCVTAGDVAKAIGAGAKIVMIAGMVSKSEECDNIVEIDGKNYVNFYGLGSNKMYERTSPTEQEYRPNEGRDLLVPCKGSINSVIQQIQGGLRSACTYVGVAHIDLLYHNTTFVRVNNTINKSLAKYEQ